MKGRPLDNMEFMQWLKFYFEGRLGCQYLDYDPVSRRWASNAHSQHTNRMQAPVMLLVHQFSEVLQARIGERQTRCDVLLVLCRHQSKSGDVKGARTGAGSGAVPRSSSTASQVSYHLCYSACLLECSLQPVLKPERI